MKSQEQISEHFRLFELGIVQNIKSCGSIQYSEYDDKENKVIYIHGTNECRDWGFNLIFIGLFYHLGFYILAKKLRGEIKGENLILIGHSQGAAIAAILYWMLGKRVKEAILLGCPPCYTIFNWLMPKRCTSYRVEGDPINKARLLNLLMRQPRTTVKLPRVSDNPLSNHYEIGYVEAFRKIIKV